MDNEEKIELLEEIGEIIYGDDWIPALTKELLNINMYTSKNIVKEMLSGERIIPDNFIAGLLAIAQDKAYMMAQKADHLAYSLRNKKGYVRVYYVPGMHHPDIRRDLYTEKRDWYRVDGRLYALNENGTIIDIEGRETDWSGESVFPSDLTVEDLLEAKRQHTEKTAF